MFRNARVSVTLSALMMIQYSHCVFAQDPTRDAVKTVIDFANLPGKGGPLKAGFRFTQSDYPELTGFSISSDVLVFPRSDTARVSRRLKLKKEAEQVEIEIYISQVSTDDAQETSVDFYIAMQSGPLDAIQNGSNAGLQIGDYSFISKGITSTNISVLAGIDFVRNNISFRIGKTNSSIDIVALASKIDAKLVAMPNLTPTQLQGRLPVISAFSPMNPIIKPFQQTGLSFTFSDPNNESVQLKFFTDFGAVVRDTSAQPPQTFFKADDSVGTTPIRVVVVNESLLFKSATTSVQVQE